MTHNVNRPDVLLALVERLYDAPESSAGWKRFLEALCNALGGSAASFVSQDFRAGRVQLAETVRTAPEVLQAYNSHWHAEDPWAHSPLTPGLTAGSVVSGDELIAPAAMRRTAFYNEFGRRHDLVHDLAGLIEVGENRLACVSINGSFGRAPFGPRDLALLRALMPHLRTALQLHRRLSAADAAASDLRHALDRLSQGVVIVARTGRVLHLNKAAAAIVAARDGCTVDAGELRAARPGDTSALRAAIRRAAQVRNGGSAVEGRLDLGRPSGRRSYVVLVTPVVEALIKAAVDSPAAMVFITDPERFVAPPEDRLRTLFGLTRVEARVSLAMLDTPDPAVVATRLGVRVSTIRSHLRQLFIKTRTTGQSDLVRLLLTLSAPAIE